ncbi:hypothetical protein ACOMHN_041559 [Nucella lapillus]
MTRLPRASSTSRLMRVILALVHAVCFLVMIVATKLSIDKFPFDIKMIKKWKSSDPGYPEHLCATFAEWVMAIVSSTYFLTFMGELKVVRTKLLVLPLDPPPEADGHGAAGANGDMESGNEVDRAGSEETLSPPDRY